MDKGLFSGFLVGLRNNNELLVSHLLFANDTLIFGRQIVNSSLNCVVYSYVLKWVWGLHINLSKSELVPIGNVVDVEGSASIFGCRVACFTNEVFGFGALYKTTFPFGLRNRPL